MLEQFARLGRGKARDAAHQPGFGHGHGSKVHTGGEESKHGIWHADLPAVARRAKELGLSITGLHMHIGSGSDLDNLARVGEALLECAREVRGTLEMISCGGGFAVPTARTIRASTSRVSRSCGPRLASASTH